MNMSQILRNENLVSCPEVKIINNNVCFLMEFMDYGDLKAAMFNNVFGSKYCSELLCGYFIIGCLKALKYMHSRLIVHSDIKLENILINSQFKVKLADFSMAKQLKKSFVYPISQIGTVPYLAPESYYFKMSQILMEKSKTINQIPPTNCNNSNNTKNNCDKNSSGSNKIDGGKSEKMKSSIENKETNWMEVIQLNENEESKGESNKNFEIIEIKEDTNTTKRNLMTKIKNTYEKNKEKVPSLDLEEDRYLSVQSTLKKDIFALGITMYRLLFKEHPYGYKHKMTREQYGLKLRESKLNIEQNKITEACEDFLRGMLEKNVNRRFSIEQAMKHRWVSICKTMIRKYEKRYGNERNNMILLINLSNLIEMKKEEEIYLGKKRNRSQMMM